MKLKPGDFVRMDYTGIAYVDQNSLIHMTAHALLDGRVFMKSFGICMVLAMPYRPTDKDPHVQMLVMCLETRQVGWVWSNWLDGRGFE